MGHKNEDRAVHTQHTMVGVGFSRQRSELGTVSPPDACSLAPGGFISLFTLRFLGSSLLAPWVLFVSPWVLFVSLGSSLLGFVCPCAYLAPAVHTLAQATRLALKRHRRILPFTRPALSPVTLPPVICCPSCIVSRGVRTRRALLPPVQAPCLVQSTCSAIDGSIDPPPPPTGLHGTRGES